MTDLPSRKLSRRAQRKRHAARQKAWRERQKAREAEALALLTQIGDDDRIIVTGKDYEDGPDRDG